MKIKHFILSLLACSTTATVVVPLTSCTQPVKPVSIYLSKTPIISFNVGATFNTTGIEVTSIYSDGSTKVVTEDCIFSSPDMSTPGTKVITVKYLPSQIQTKYDIVVKEPTTVFHTVTFNLQGGTIEGLEGNTMEIPDKTLVGQLPTPVKTNYIFDKWLDNQQQEIPSIQPIENDMTVTASYHLTKQSHIEGGSRLLEIKSDATGSDKLQWVLKDASGGTMQNPDWSITNKATGQPLEGLTISNGIVSWNKVKAGSYTAVIKATKGEITETAEIGVVSTDTVYKLSGGSELSTAYFGVGGSATNAWSLTKDGSSVTSGITWGVTGTTETSITVPNGKLTWTAATPAGTYSLNITATINSQVVASVPVSLIINKNTYTISGGTSKLNAKMDIDGSDSASWSIYKNGSATAETNIQWELSGAPTGVSISNGKVSWTGLSTATEYTFKVQGKNSTKTEVLAETTVTLIVANAYKLSGGTESSTAHIGEAGTATTAWSLTKDGSSVTSGITWGVTGTTETSITAPNGKLTWTAATPAGTYSLNITATVNSQVVATAPASLSLLDNTYSVTSPLSTVTIKDNVTKTDTTNKFAFYRNTTEITSGVTWSVTSNPTIPTGGSVTWDSTENALKYTTVPAGTYTLTVTAKWTDATSTERSASKLITLASESTKSESIEITGESKLLTTQKSEYTATVHPSTSVTNLIWSVEGWTGTTATKPEFETSTATNKNKLITKAGSEGKATIQVKDTISEVSKQFTVDVAYPQTNSDKIWTDTTSGSYMSLKIDDLAGETAKDTITAYDIDGNEIVGGVTRTSLNTSKLYIGDSVASLPDYFLCGWTTYNGTITFATNSKLSVIGSNFLDGCEVYNNGSAALALPSSLKVIGSYFLDGCKAFNNGGNAFTLPASLQTIGSDFMNECETFNQNLTIDTSVVYVGDNFLTNCNSMVATLTINVAEPSKVFYVASDISYTCATEDETALCYTTGITIAGTGATEFKSIFENRTESPYRKLI